MKLYITTKKLIMNNKDMVQGIGEGTVQSDVCKTEWNCV
jgi:hypothetical protein